MTNTADAIFSSPEFADFLFNNISVAIFLVDKRRRVRRINDPFKTLFLATDEATLNQLCGNALGCEFAVNQNKPCGDTTECANCKIRDSLLRDEGAETEIKTTYVTRSFFIDGKATPKHFQLTTKQAFFEGESMTIVALHDVTELEDQRAKIEEMANTDFLTGLSNRRYFFEVGESLFQNAKRGNISISVAMFDIDHFKRVNDSSGHAAGDFVIKGIAEILTANLRKADVIARFGGEEFCIILHCKDRDDSYTVVDKLRLLVEQHVFMFEGKKIDVTISAGLTSVIGGSLDEMVDKADEMLYKAKNGGRNRTEEYTGAPK